MRPEKKIDRRVLESCKQIQEYLAQKLYELRAEFPGWEFSYQEIDEYGNVVIDWMEEE